jgi:hypothetical protein
VTEACTIPLGRGREALLDVADLPIVRAYTWYPLEGHNGKVYAIAQLGSRTFYMHRLIAGTPPGLETDHRNGDGLDNRRANLRVATPSQNSANTGKPRRPDGTAHSSQYKGVSWDRSRGRWQAKLARLDPSIGRTRTFNLGRFDVEVDAARAYDVAALAAWGEFARLNFPTTRQVVS